jgi:glutathione S-transferase
VFNNEVLTESGAILRFVAQMIDSLKKYYPEDPLFRHKVDAALDYCGNTLRPYINKTLHICFKALNTKGRLESFEKEAIKENKKKIREQYYKLEEMLH